MGSLRTPQANSPLKESYTYAWIGTRYCDLQVSETNLRLIQDDLAIGHDKEDYIAVTAYLIDKESRRIVFSQDLCLDNPYPESHVISRVNLWFHATLDVMTERNSVEVAVEIKEG